MNFSDRTPRWLDAETGQVSSITLDDGDILDAASCAPWVDEKGLRQVAGRWSSRTQQGPMSISTDFGLARYSFPGGQLLDHVSTEIVPVGPPCWFPGVRARILFAAGDGQLYQYAFEGEPNAKSIDHVAQPDAKPIHLTWRCSRPGGGKVFLSDLTWPEDPRLSDFVVVALREQSRNTEVPSFTGTALWWLRLNLAGTEIVECGRLLEPSGEDHSGGTLDQRCPVVGTLKGGKPVLAYLSEDPKKHGWDVRIAPIEFEGDRHVPRVHQSSSLLLSTDCQPAHPCFSTDGRWLNVIAESTEPNGRVLRLSLAKAFPSTK